MRGELSDGGGRRHRRDEPRSRSRSPTTETERLLAAADLVTLARTGVEYDYRGDVIDAHAPEMPTRFAKQLTQIVRGAVAIGMDRADALRLAMRCARDSMPPLRLAHHRRPVRASVLDPDRGAQAAGEAEGHC